VCKQTQIPMQCALENRNLNVPLVSCLHGVTSCALAWIQTRVNLRVLPKVNVALSAVSHSAMSQAYTSLTRSLGAKSLQVRMC
jgi:hypothetical protein